MNWKRFMLSSTLLVTLACGDSEGEGPLGDGGGDAMNDGGGVDLDGGTDIDGRVGNGNRDGGGADGDGSGGGEKCDQLSAVIRDFKKSHPDFEKFSGSTSTLGMVETTLGPDYKPVYTGVCQAGGPGPCPNGQQSSGKANFDEWYNDRRDAGVNMRFEVELPLKPSEVVPNQYEYVERMFFPIDGEGFLNEGNAHNYHFTTEIHTSFTYLGDQKFTFIGDDDLWIFVNGRLALDLGGLHSELVGEIDFDAKATQLGIEKGKTYRMDIFHAERHTTESRFSITTTIECFKDVPIVI